MKGKSLVVLALVAALLAACSKAPCEAMCDKLQDCGNLVDEWCKYGVCHQTDCRRACATIETELLSEAFTEMQACIEGNACGDIGEGDLCYWELGNRLGPPSSERAIQCKALFDKARAACGPNESCRTTGYERICNEMAAYLSDQRFSRMLTCGGESDCDDLLRCFKDASYVLDFDEYRVTTSPYCP